MLSIHSGFATRLCDSTSQVGALRLNRLSESGHMAGKKGPGANPKPSNFRSNVLSSVWH